MFIRTENEINSVMPTSRWSKPTELLPYLEEEERGALEPLLGTALYEHLCTEYERLREAYVDITATTIKPTGKAKEDPGLPYADVTERMDAIQQGVLPAACGCVPMPEEEVDVPASDLKTIRLLRICQRIEFYKMLSHKAGLLTVSFNEGGGMNKVSADGYEPADEKDKERATKDAYMSAGRAIDDLLLFLEADAKGDRLFTEKWQEADAFYLHKDLLFQTARVLKEFLGTKIDRMTYIDLVHDIRYCQNTYLKPRVGAKLLKAVIDYANEGEAAVAQQHTEQEGEWSATAGFADGTGDELLSMLRTALAFYVESRRTTITHTTSLAGSSSRSSSAIFQKEEKLARRDSMTDAQQAMAMACEYIEENLEALGDAAVDSPIYKKVKAAEQQAATDAQNAEAAQRRRCRQQCEQNSRKLFTGFPATHRTPERK